MGGLVMADHTLLTYNAGAMAAFAGEAAPRGYRAAVLAQKRRAPGAMGWTFRAIFRRAAYFVDQILKGAKPGDIPMEQATKFLSAVNLKTAKALGIDIPTSICLSRRRGIGHGMNFSQRGN